MVRRSPGRRAIRGFARPGTLHFLTLIALFVGLYALLSARPQVGAVTGRITDTETGQPISGAWVSLSLTEDSEGAGKPAQKQDLPVVEDPSGATTAPYGWAQGAASDGRDDMSLFTGKHSGLDAKTDADGRFTISNVPVGHYELSGSADSYQYMQTSLPVEVVEEQTAQQDLKLTPDADYLNIYDGMTCWLPNEDVVLSLNGSLRDPAIQLTLDRADAADVIKKEPQILAGGPDEHGEVPVAPDEIFKPVKSWPLQRTGKAGRPVMERVHVGQLPEGVYRFTAANPGFNIRAWFVVTRLAVVRKTYADKVLTYVCDLATGAAVPGATVAVYQDLGTALDSGTTGADGLCTLSVKGGAKESKGILVAQSGQSAAGVHLELGVVGEQAGTPDGGDEDGNVAASPGALRSFIYTDRTVYRPGHTVNFKGILRRFLLATHALQIPADQKVSLDIRDPQSTLVSHQDLTTNAMGSWNGSVDLSPEALTGEYSIQAEINGEKAESTFVVAAYRKPEYKVAIKFDKPRYVRGDTLTASVNAQYYFGAPVAGAKAHYNVVESGDTFEDGPYGADAGNNQPSHSGEDDQDGDIRLDDHGQAVIHIPTHPRAHSVDTPYEINVSVEDPSGRSVDETATATVGQGEFALSTTLSRDFALPGQPVTARIEATEPDPAKAGASDVAMRPRANQSVHVVMGISTWKNGQEALKSPQTMDVTTGADGVATVTVPTAAEGLVEIRASATDARGNGIDSTQYLWVASGNGDTEAQYPNLGLVLDKEKYSPGDMAHVLVNTDTPGATALVTLEGATLYRAWTVPLTHHSTAVDVPVTAEYAPGINLSVCCIAKKQFLTSSQKLTIDDPQRRLAVTVTSDAKTYGPGGNVTLKVHTADTNGLPKAAEVSVGVVDSALYAIRPEPDGTIEDAFLPDQGNAVDTQYSCAYRYVGDVDKGAMGVKLRSKFRDTALWMPVVMTDATGDATVHFTLPENLTTWRVTSYGQTADTSVGKGTSELLVSKDLVARLEAPAFLTDGDRATIAAVINNNGTSSFSVKAQLTAQSATGAALTVSDSGAPKSVDVPAGQSARVEWPVSVALGKDASALSVASGAAAETTLTGPVAPVTLKLSVLASNGQSDGVEQTLPIQPRAALSDTWQSGSLINRADRFVTPSPNAIPGATRLRIRISPTVSGALLPAIDYLAEYPYETTDAAASALLTNVIVAQATSGAQPSFPMNDARKKLLPDQIDRCQRRLYRLQSDEGNWGWCMGRRGDFWMTAYATWALGRATKAGYVGNSDAYKSALDATASLMKSGSHRGDFVDGNAHGLAIAALALAEGGHADDAKEALKKLEAVWVDPSQSQANADRALAALAYKSVDGAAGTHAAAFMARIWASRQNLGQLTAWPAYAVRVQPNAAAGSAIAQDAPEVEATAWVLTAAQEITPSDKRIDSIARWLMANRTGGDHWGAPSDTALTVMALTRYMAQSHEMQPLFDAQVLINGKTVNTTHFGPESIDRPDVVLDIPGAGLAPGKNTVRVQKTGQGRLYYSIDLREGLPAGPAVSPPSFWRQASLRLFHPDRLEPPFTPSGYRIKRVYLRNTSRRNFLWEDTVPAPGTDYRHNDIVLVRLIIDNTRPGSHLIVEEPVPPGCTITDVSGDQTENWDNWWDYTDVRDDKIVFLIGNLPRGRHEILYHLKAETTGAYDVMPTHIMGTFDPTLHALGAVSHVTVE